MRWRALGVVCAAAVAWGCGGGEKPEVRFPFLSAADPIDLTRTERGVGVRSGEALAMATNVPGGITKTTGAFDHVIYRLRAYDDQTQRLGEYTQHPVGQTGRTASTFVEQPSLGDVDRRAQDLRDEVDSALAQAGASGFETRSVVVDLFRTRGDWYVRWDGLLSDSDNRQGKGNYGLGREQMFNDLLARMERVARDHEPTYFVIGDGMERLLADAGGEGLSPAEWANFVIFFEEASTRIRAASPQTKVGAGIDWDNFVDSVALSYSSNGTVNNAEIDAAFQDVILPLFEYSDVLTIKSRTAPGEDDDPKDRYQFFRRLSALYGASLPVVVYGMSRPIGTSSGEAAQRNHVEEFADWMSGVNVEAIFWERWINIDGADTADQKPIGRCAALTSDETLEFQIPVSHCNDGLFDSTFQTKPVWESFSLEE